MPPRKRPLTRHLGEDTSRGSSRGPEQGRGLGSQAMLIRGRNKDSAVKNERAPGKESRRGLRPSDEALDGERATARSSDRMPAALSDGRSPARWRSFIRRRRIARGRRSRRSLRPRPRTRCRETNPSGSSRRPLVHRTARGRREIASPSRQRDETSITRRGGALGGTARSGPSERAASGGSSAFDRRAYG